MSVGTAMKGCGPWTRGGDADRRYPARHRVGRGDISGAHRGIFHVEGSGGARVLAFLNSANYPAVWVAQGTEWCRSPRPTPILTATWTHLAVTLTPATSGGLPATDAGAWVDRVSAGTATLDPFHGWLGSRKVIVGSDGTRKYPWRAASRPSPALDGVDADADCRIAAARDGAAGDDAGHRASRLVWSCGARGTPTMRGLSTMSAQPVDAGRRWPTRCKPAPTRNARSGGSTVRDGRRCAPVVAVGNQPAATVPRRHWTPGCGGKPTTTAASPSPGSKAPTEMRRSGGTATGRRSAV